MSSDLRALVFDFDGLMIDSERVEADCIIEALAGWGVTVGYQDFGHMDEARTHRLLLGLATGSTVPTLEKRLGRHGVFDRFDAIVPRSGVPAGKPAPDIFVETARRLGVTADACLALEDSVHGCEAALRAGMRVIACPSVVTAHCSYPDGVQVVTSLTDVTLRQFAA